MCPAQVGTVEYPEPHIILNVPVEAPRSGAIGAGEVLGYPNDTGDTPIFYGVTMYTKVDDDIVPCVIHSEIRVRKITATVFAQFDYVHFEIEVTGAQDYYLADLAATGEEIHAIALEVAGNTATDLLIWGPYLRPFTLA